MKRILFPLFLVFIPLIPFSVETVWSTIKIKDKDYNEDFFWSQGNYFYQIQTESNQGWVKKINRRNLLTLDSTLIDLTWDDKEHEILKTFKFESRLWVLTQTHDVYHEIATTWIHLLDTLTLKISNPIKVANYNLPYNKSAISVSLEDRTERLFSSNLIRVETSFLNGYCMTMSCKDLVRVYSFENRDKQQDRIIETTLYDGSFDNKIIVEFHPPSPNFFIYKAVIDLDGSVYMLGRTIVQKIEQLHQIPYIEESKDLQIIKYNPYTGGYISELIEDDFPNFNDYNLSVDRGVTITGRSLDVLNNEYAIVGATYSKQLIKTNTYHYALNDSIGLKMNSLGDVETYNSNYNKAFGKVPDKVPLLNFDLIYSEIMDNGDLIFILESRNIAILRNGFGDLYSTLILFSLNKEGEHNWTKYIDKDQRSLINSEVGVYIYSDGKNLNLWYNESDRLQNLAVDPNKNYSYDERNKLMRIRYLRIDREGDININEKIEFSDKHPLLLETNACYEIEPGIVLLKATNSKSMAIGMFEPF